MESDRSSKKNFEDGRNNTDYLSTTSAADPLTVLDKFGSEQIVMITLAVEPRHTRTGHLEKKGQWIKSVWQLVLSAMPEIQGCRLSWNTLFFIAASRELESVGEQFQGILKSVYDSDLVSFCVLSEAEGAPNVKLMQLDRMLGEISTARNFGSDAGFQYRLLDGADWLPKT